MPQQFPLATTYADVMNSKAHMIECTQELADDALNALPPYYAPGCFGMGEPHSHADDGAPITVWFAQIGGKWYALLGTRIDAIAVFDLARAAFHKVAV